MKSYRFTVDCIRRANEAMQDPQKKAAALSSLPRSVVRRIQANRLTADQMNQAFAEAVRRTKASAGIK